MRRPWEKVDKSQACYEAETSCKASNEAENLMVKGILQELFQK